jgi:hypothetical protein
MNDDETEIFEGNKKLFKTDPQPIANFKPLQSEEKYIP